MEDRTGPESLLPAVQYLQKVFDDDTFIQLKDMYAIKEHLTERIVYLLLHEMERLLHILYRIDVNEKHVKACFAQNDPNKIAPMLADLIIERELQKIRYRNENR